MKVILINKGGNIKETSINNFKIENLYKKCLFSNNNNFEKRCTWKLNETTNVSVFAKNIGRAHTENKFDFPPPIDKELFFGRVVLCAHKGEKLNNTNSVDLTKTEWKKMYDKLMGGFEDLDKDSIRSEDPEDYDDSQLTKEGYLMNSFIVKDTEPIELIENNTESEDEYTGSETDSDYEADTSELEEEVYK